MTESHPEYQVNRRLYIARGNSDYYELTVDHGYADVTFEKSTRWLGVANIIVEPEFRRQGRAKAMLGHVAMMADELDAKLIFAAIISRESIDAFVSVFGKSAVDIECMGDYDNSYSASATLMLARS